METKVQRRINGWKKSNTYINKMIAYVITNGGKVRKDLLLQELQQWGSVSPYGTLAQAKTEEGNSYGKAFIEDEGFVMLNPREKDLILRVWSSDVNY